jgi:hypothetical protein
VRSPYGGPANLTSVRRWGTDAKRYENVLGSGWKANDEQQGVISLACAENAADPVQASVCKSWNAAREADATVAALGPDLSVNGRFFGTLAIDAAAIARGAGNVAFEIADTDDAGMFDANDRWERSGGTYVKRFTVPNFYDDLATPFTLSLINGVVSIGKDSNGLPTLTVRTADADGASHLITAALR